MPEYVLSTSFVQHLVLQRRTNELHIERRFYRGAGTQKLLARDSRQDEAGSEDNGVDFYIIYSMLDHYGIEAADRYSEMKDSDRHASFLELTMCGGCDWSLHGSKKHMSVV